MVIAARSQAMTLAAMTGAATDYVEASRMVTEKMAAAAESVVAANTAFVKEGIDIAAGLAAGRVGPAAGHKRIAAAALRPFAKRVRANARRLAK